MANSFLITEKIKLRSNSIQQCYNETFLNLEEFVFHVLVSAIRRRWCMMNWMFFLVLSSIIHPSFLPVFVWSFDLSSWSVSFCDLLFWIQKEHKVSKTRTPRTIPITIQINKVMFDEVVLPMITNENDLDVLTNNLFVLDDSSDFCVELITC